MLPRPYSNCEIDSNYLLTQSNLEFYNLIDQSGYEYTRQLCFIQCYQNFIIKKYNCSHPSLLSLFNVRNCDLNANQFNSTDVSFSINLINEMCLASCPLECKKTLYKTTLSSSQLIANSYVSKIKNNPKLASDFYYRNIDTNSVKEGIVNLNIFYESLSYTQSIELPRMDFVSLLASIGGNLSLFLGVSFFSLFEVIQLFMEIFYKKTRKC